jgi:hypothetical protein
LKFLARAVRQQEEIKGLWVGKEAVKLSLFAHDMILHLKDPKKNFTKKLSDIVSTFSKESGYKNSFKNQQPFYIPTMNSLW